MKSLELAAETNGMLIECGIIAGVRYVMNGSPVSPRSTAMSIMSLSEPIVLITVDNGQASETELDSLAQTIEDGGVIHVLAHNGTHALAAALRKVGYTHYTLSPKPVVELLRTAYALADEGDVVLMSPLSNHGRDDGFEADAREAFLRLSEAYHADEQR